MIQVSEYLIEILKNYPALAAAVQSRIFPLFANEGTRFPFAVYGFGEVSSETKDACAYNVNVAVWFEPNNVTEAYQMADDLKELAEKNPWEFINTNVGADEENRKIFSEINFKIIM
ncbi:Protein of unknown function [Paenimyroides ummariense]|uniref:DUF3168 domain-containing protein n=1 Tax=Paenimyroides ummariense TaxID=913024 RepID=A0A1I5E010_9FLAO|nr:DUF3168 domain-containing protein [Paenimyroides ummariense]SFO04786.1 Protein of unknown function [Paenimyroides ummariense]